MSVKRTLFSVTKLCTTTRNLYTSSIVSSHSASSNFVQKLYAQTSRNITSSNNNNSNISNTSSGGLNNHAAMQCGTSYPRRNLAPRSHSYTTALSNMTKDQANDFVFRLNDQERQLLLQVLTQFQSVQNRNDVEVEQTPKPTSNELMKLSLINSLPFIGFGFLDNFTMIIAGDYIEHSIAGFITISTMAAAALGNTISDVLGIGSAYYVERISEKVGIKPPKLSPIQLEMPSSRRAANIGRVLGITIGCLLGMCPLLFMNSEQDVKPTDPKVSAMAED